MLTLGCRHALRARLLRPRQTLLCVRWASKVAGDYVSKLESKAKEEGVSVEELIEKYREKAKEAQRAEGEDLVKHFRPRPAEKSDFIPKIPKTNTDKATKDLASYIDVEKFQAHSKKEIEMLWKARFVHSNNEFCGAMNADAFSRLYVNARKFPKFVLPLPRDEGTAELHYIQWSFMPGNTLHCLITGLAEYKLHTEYAHPHTTVLVHSDLVADKGVALVNTVMTKAVPMDAAVLLLLNLQRFYTADPTNLNGAEKLKLLYYFNHGSPEFQIERLINAVETID